jgi:hypothetical protein
VRREECTAASYQPYVRCKIDALSPVFKAIAHCICKARDMSRMVIMVPQPAWGWQCCISSNGVEDEMRGANLTLLKPAS